MVTNELKTGRLMIVTGEVWPRERSYDNDEDIYFSEFDCIPPENVVFSPVVLGSPLNSNDFIALKRL